MVELSLKLSSRRHWCYSTCPAVPEQAVSDDFGHDPFGEVHQTKLVIDVQALSSDGNMVSGDFMPALKPHTIKLTTPNAVARQRNFNLVSRMIRAHAGRGYALARLKRYEKTSNIGRVEGVLDGKV